MAARECSNDIESKIECIVCQAVGKLQNKTLLAASTIAEIAAKSMEKQQTKMNEQLDINLHQLHLKAGVTN